MPLQLQPNLQEPGQRYFRAFSPGDDFYEALIEAHRDLSDEQSDAFFARLLPPRATLFPDTSVLRAALALARQDL